MLMLASLQDMNDSEETPQLHFPLKIEWPSRKSFGFDEDDSDERPDSGVGESVSLHRFWSLPVTQKLSISERFTINGRAVPHERLVEITT